MSYAMTKQSPAQYKFFATVCSILSLKATNALPVPASNFSEEFA